MKSLFSSFLVHLQFLVSDFQFLLLRPRVRTFCTPVHRFAQSFARNLIDAANAAHYLAQQIEPEAQELYGSVEKAQQA